MNAFVYSFILLTVFSTPLFKASAFFGGSFDKNSPSRTQGRAKELKSFFHDKWKLNNGAIEHLLEGEVLAEASADSDEERQFFALNAAGLHKKKCGIVLRKLRMLEKYQDWISFVQESKYHERSKLFTVKADHTLLPYPMIVHIIMERPSKPGRYKFKFPTGIFAGLTGEYVIEDMAGGCLIYAKSRWKGQKTKIPDMAVELFVEGLTKKAAEILMRKTRF